MIIDDVWPLDVACRNESYWGYIDPMYAVRTKLLNILNINKQRKHQREK